MGISKRLIEEAESYLDGSQPRLTNILLLCFFNSGFQLNLFYRLTHKLYKSFASRRLLWLIPRIITYLERVLASSYIDPKAKIGKRFRILYGFNIVIGAKVEIGDDVMIFNGTSIGSAVPGLLDIKQPKIGSGVFIGAGAKLLGGITIGDNVKIGANSVVLKSFGPNVTIAGIPAKIVKKHSS